MLQKRGINLRRRFVITKQIEFNGLNRSDTRIPKGRQEKQEQEEEEGEEDQEIE